MSTKPGLDLTESFPRGLVQPPGSYRFGEDALLLGSWSARVLNCWLERKKTRPERVNVAELGSGCGAALFALSLLAPEAHGLGLEREPSLVEAARINAASLRLEDRVNFSLFDIGADQVSEPGARRLVISNPPWRKTGTGRETLSRLRRIAMTRSDNRAFYKCAAELLVSRGFFCLILPMADFCEFCADIKGTALGVRRVLPLAAFAEKNPDRVLICCQKQTASDPVFEFPLILYEKKNGAPVPTAAALSICPALGVQKLEKA